VPTGKIEPKTSDWDQIRSAPGICVVGKAWHGEFYEVAVCDSYIPWLESHKFEFELGYDYDRTKPADVEVQSHGKLPAQRRAQARFLENLMREISSGRGRRFERYCLSITPYQFRIPLERAILNHNALVNSTLAIPKESC
jgi:hypothetical protein